MDLEALETVGDIARHIASTRGDIIGDWTNIELHLDGCLLPEDEASKYDHWIDHFIFYFILL